MAIMRSRVYCGDSETFREIVPRIGRAGCCLFAAAEARGDPMRLSSEPRTSAARASGIANAGHADHPHGCRLSAWSGLRTLLLPALGQGLYSQLTLYPLWCNSMRASRSQLTCSIVNHGPDYVDGQRRGWCLERNRWTHARRLLRLPFSCRLRSSP